MGIQFNADEIFEIAERIEVNGARFYRKAADNTADDKSKKMLQQLASMEDDHEQTFAKMRADLTADEKKPNLFDPTDEVVLYLNAFADGHIFDSKSDPSEKLTGDESLEQILRMAIGLEKDSIVFYLGIQEMVGEGQGRDRIQDIIKEERSHIALLARELSAARHA